MSVDERTRHEIHARFEELLGPELAGAFMSYLPPVGWADVATKRDLEALRSGDLALIRRDIEALEHRLDATLHRELNSQTRTLFFSLSSFMLTLAGLAFAVARLS